MKILLINPPIRGVMFNLGLGYIARSLREEGHKIEVLDIDACQYSKETVKQKLKDYDFEAVGITGMITVYSYIKWLTSIIKNQYQVPIIVGGNGATSIPRLYLEKAGADIVVIGEGENTVKEVFGALQNHKELENVDGIWFKRKGKIFSTPPRRLIENLDSIPYPAWDLFPINKYIERTTHKVGSLKPMVVSTIRGCPYKCVYCYHCFQGYKSRFRSIESIIEEIKILKKRYKIELINFADDLFPINRKRVLDFCRRFNEENLDVKWSAAARVNLVDEELLKTMASAGCIDLGYGVESGSQTILDRMDKRATVEQAEKAINATRKAGIHFSTTFMIGMAGETKETLQETIDFIKRMNLDVRHFFFTTPYPGTRLWDYAKEKGLITNDEEVISQYGEMEDSMLVNLTDFSDKELKAIKARAEKEIRRAFRRHRRMRRIARKIKTLLKIDSEAL